MVVGWVKRSRSTQRLRHNQYALLYHMAPAAASLLHESAPAPHAAQHDEEALQ